MAKFVYIFVGGAPAKGEEEANMKAWGDWIKELSDKKVYLNGLPFGWTKKVVNPDGSVTEYKGQSSGYAVVEAESMDQTIEWAKGGPNGKYGGTTEVYDVMDIPGM